MRCVCWLPLCAGFVALACAPAPAPQTAARATPSTALSAQSAPSAAPPVAAASSAKPEGEAGRTVHWRGSRVSLWAPATMRRPSRLQYLRQDEPLVVIAVAEMTAEDLASTQQMLAGARDGAGVVEQRPVEHGKSQGFLGRGAPDGSGLSREVLGLADGLSAVIIVAQYQPAAAPLVAKILDSVTLDPSAELDPLALNGIQLGDDAGFVVDRSSSHPVLLYERGKKLPLKPGEPSFMLLSLPYPKSEISDQELGQLLGLTLAKFRPFMPSAKMDAFPIAGRQAFVMSVPAFSDKIPVGLYAFVVRCPDVAFAGFGHVELSAMNRVAPRFERLVKSLTLDDALIESAKIQE